MPLCKAVRSAHDYKTGLLSTEEKKQFQHQLHGHKLPSLKYQDFYLHFILKKKKKFRGGRPEQS